MSVPDDVICYVHKEKIQELIDGITKEQERILKEILEYFCHDLSINQDEYVNRVKSVLNL